MSRISKGFAGSWQEIGVRTRWWEANARGDARKGEEIRLWEFCGLLESSGDCLSILALASSAEFHSLCLSRLPQDVFARDSAIYIVAAHLKDLKFTMVAFQITVCR